ncbi:hypothetical protein KP509_37G006100 [Ceratopteris richardii]|uniref:YTH domain-containing protein n=1 Tax=Ceratopteris richardii TaxID=49495 RepID=A0A8T2Q658_CERRI|nr:hypothetical protein KP509_37G006100 [Ceratopteris richardii]
MRLKKRFTSTEFLKVTTHHKNSEKSVLDDIMGDPGDFGEIGASDIESDGGRWEDTLREMEQCDTGVEENLQRKILDPQVSSDASHDLGQKKNLKIVADKELGDEPREKQGQLKTMTHSIPKEVSYIPVSIKNNKACKPNAVYSKRFFIIKSLNYHNLEKSVEKGIWATQAMNERILNEAFETAEKVLLIFSMNMSGHFQGYAQMTSPIGKRKVNNPLNSFKPVKINRDCQELTTEIGEALCALIDGGADSEFSKRRIHVRSDYFMKKPCMERLFHESADTFSFLSSCGFLAGT